LKQAKILYFLAENSFEKSTIVWIEKRTFTLVEATLKSQEKMSL